MDPSAILAYPVGTRVRVVTQPPNLRAHLARPGDVGEVEDSHPGGQCVVRIDRGGPSVWIHAQHLELEGSDGLPDPFPEEQSAIDRMNAECDVYRREAQQARRKEAELFKANQEAQKLVDGLLAERDELTQANAGLRREAQAWKQIANGYRLLAGEVES